MINFTIKPFRYEEHIIGVKHLMLNKASQSEIDNNGLKEHLGFTTPQVLLDYLFGSDEAYVFINRQHQIVGICGCFQGVAQGTICSTPWFFSNGFHKLKNNRRAFLRSAHHLMDSWEVMARGRLFHGYCCDTMENRRLLEFLGFMWSSSELTTRLIFRKKGERSNYGLTICNGFVEHGIDPCRNP